MKRKFISTTAIPILCLLAVMFAAGCGGGGKSLENVLVTDNNSSNTFVEGATHEKTAALIGPADTTFARYFLNADGSAGQLISTSGATYNGDDNTKCAECHSDIVETFKVTNHSTAASRKITAGTITGASCMKCHTLDGPLIPTVAVGASGAVYGTEGTFGMTPTTYAVPAGTTTAAYLASLLGATMTKTGIQCENCHGPASLHIGANGAPVSPTSIVNGKQAMSAATCGVCHDAPTHHSKPQQWRQNGGEESGHSAALGYADNIHMAGKSCNGCHSAEGFVNFTERLAALPTAQPYDTLTDAQAAAMGVTAATMNVNCAACHDPHATTPGTKQLRVSAEKLCSFCHRGRPNKAPGGSNSPHHNQQDLMLKGEYGVSLDDKFYMKNTATTTAGRDPIVPKYAAGGTEATTLYYTPVDSGIGAQMGSATCVSCHVSEDHGGLADHSFKAKPEACVKCHSGMNAASVIGQKQYEFTKKLTALRTRLAAAAAANTASAFTGTTRKLYINAKFNADVVDFDGSKGVHNTAFANLLMSNAGDMLTQIGY